MDSSMICFHIFVLAITCVRGDQRYMFSIELFVIAALCADIFYTSLFLKLIDYVEEGNCQNFWDVFLAMHIVGNA
jgi:hypothetical protein